MTIDITYTQSFDFSLTSYSTPRRASGIGDGAQTPSASTNDPTASAVTGSTPASAPASAAPASAFVDRVELSSGATAQTASPDGSGTPQAGGALFSALDADKDGSVTAQEFTDGATALLRRAGARHHRG